MNIAVEYTLDFVCGLSFVENPWPPSQRRRGAPNSPREAPPFARGTDFHQCRHTTTTIMPRLHSLGRHYSVKKPGRKLHMSSLSHLPTPCTFLALPPSISPTPLPLCTPVTQFAVPVPSNFIQPFRLFTGGRKAGRSKAIRLRCPHVSRRRRGSALPG